MDRSVSKIPGRGLPPSLMAASLRSRFPLPNSDSYQNCLRNVSSRRCAAWQSFGKGCRVPSDAGRGRPGREIPAAFPESWEHKNNSAALWYCDVMTSRLPAPPPGVRTARGRGGWREKRGRLPGVLSKPDSPEQFFATTKILYFEFYWDCDIKNGLKGEKMF